MPTATPPRINYDTTDANGNGAPRNLVGHRYEHVDTGHAYHVSRFAYGIDERWQALLTRAGSAALFVVPLTMLLDGHAFKRAD